MTNPAGDPRILLITGTDTGIGKTLVASALASSLNSRGISIEVIKPVESGCELAEDGSLLPADGELLSSAASTSRSMEDVVPWRFAAPVAPLVAAELEDGEIAPDVLEKTVASAYRDCDLLLVEGAGGLLVPLGDYYTFADLAAGIKAAVIVVVGSRLGAINHALLTFEVLRKRKIKVIGYVFNDLFNQQNLQAQAAYPQSDQAIQTNRALLSRLARAYELEEIGFFPYLSNNVDFLADCRSGVSPEITRFSDAIIEYFGLSR